MESSSAIAQTDHEDGILVDKRVFGDGIEGCAVAIQLGLKVSRRAIALTLANARLVHAHSGKAGLFDEPPKNRAEAIGLPVRVFDAIAAQPADEEDYGHFASCRFRPSHEGSDFLAARI